MSTTNQLWWLISWTICPACLRSRLNPIHWIVRAIGLCPGAH